MRCLVFYHYPLEADGQSLQGDLLYRGLLYHKQDAIPCHFKDSLQKKFYLKHLKPNVAFGVGFWGNVTDIIRAPLKYGITPVPWFNADGWVANFHDDFEKLKLMFTTSNWVREVYKRDGVDVSKIVPAHIGIDTNLFKPMANGNSNSNNASNGKNNKNGNANGKYRDAIRKMFGVKNGEKMILTAGGDVTSKGAQEMMKALAEVDKEFANWHYVCKSWPSECAQNWREIELQLADELGIRDKITFIDDEFSPEFMVYLLNACDIYAAPSRLEGFGMIQVEAMSCGKPVISINKMGPAETIAHKKTGFLAKVAEEVLLEGEWVYEWMGFPKKEFMKFKEPKVFGYRADVNELKEYTLKLLTEPELCEKMGKQAREHAVKNFDYHITSKKMLDVTRERLGID